MTEIDTQAAPAPLQVRVKELEWTESADIDACSVFGIYEITRGSGYWYPHVPGIHGPVDYTLRSKEAAKAACQADYERRILSTLDLSTAPQIAALEAEIVKLRSERDEAIRQSDAVCDSYARENGQLHERAERAEAEVARLTEALKAEQADAERWRALLRCARIRMQGSAGFDPKTGKRQQYSNATSEYEDRSDGWVHFGAEFWSVWPGAEDPDPETRWGTIALKALADDVLLKEREAAAPEPKP